MADYVLLIRLRPNPVRVAEETARQFEQTDYETIDKRNIMTHLSRLMLYWNRGPSPYRRRA